MLLRSSLTVLMNSGLGLCEDKNSFSLSAPLSLRETNFKNLQLPKSSSSSPTISHVSMKKTLSGTVSQIEEEDHGVGPMDVLLMQEGCEADHGRLMAAEATVVGDGDGSGGGGRFCHGGGGGGSGGGDGRDDNGSDFGERDGMDVYYQNMIEGDPTNPLLLSNYARYLKEVGDYHKAEEYYGRALLADPIGEGNVLTLYADLIWLIYKDASRAQNYFDQALKLAPDDCYVMASYARFLWDSDYS